MDSGNARTQDFLDRVGDRVRTVRKDRGLTMQELAEAAGLSRRMLSQVELGQANPSLATIDKIAHALGTDFAGLALPRTVGGSAKPEGSGAVDHPRARTHGTGCDEPAAASGSDSTAHTGTVTWENERGSRAVILGASTRHGAELWRWTIAPHDEYRAEPDRAGAQEIHHVLTGTLTIETETGTLEIPTGSSAVVDSDLHYTYRAGKAGAEFVRVVAGA